MPTRHGITNDPYRRERELKREYAGFKNFKIIKKFPNKEAAQKYENKQPNAHPGGPKADGPYYMYSHYYTRRR